ncbi:hypothetical protein BZA05DRAFT_20679 [Tricharina praecox]|uniref:uncharacterized protein n=1 Tax=Tricharina praecox TaxID=43433 RepID=UPI00221F1CE9|nr:uncharacterized protein BZA05DRAFT_20679 [Tricharina praecox]KAI5859059.1 hypothetical protein BZA05DRAFT_20679 [Tricharina praecox]
MICQGEAEVVGKERARERERTAEMEREFGLYAVGCLFPQEMAFYCLCTNDATVGMACLLVIMSLIFSTTYQVLFVGLSSLLCFSCIVYLFHFTICQVKSFSLSVATASCCMLLGICKSLRRVQGG